LKIKKINAERMGYSNKLMVFNLIRYSPGISRNEITKLTGLDKSTVTKITYELISRGLVEEGERKSSKSPGRKPIRLEAAKGIAASIIVKVGVEKTIVGLGFLNNFIEKMIEFETPKNFNTFIDKLTFEVDNIYKNSNGHNIVGISFSFPGMIDRKNLIIEYVPHFNWSDIKLKDIFLKELPYWDKPILAANEAKLALQSEIYFNEEISNLNNGVYIFVSQGIGGAILIDGKIHLGSNYTAGEFGHMSIQESGEKCFCNNQGCWETFASIDTITKIYEYSNGKLKGATYEEKFKNLLEKSEKRSTNSYEIMNQMLYYLAVGTVNLINILNPEFVIIGGYGYLFPDKYLKQIEHTIRERALKPSLKSLEKIVKSSFDIETACLTGANLRVMDEFAEKAVI
jgi:predicted NBD/HSP70 family sugar kinase